MKFILTALLLAWSCTSLAECKRPDAPVIPDGDVSDLATMVEGQGAVKIYVAATEAYLDCLTAENEAAGEEVSDEEQASQDETYNSAVDEMEAVAAEFNEEIQEYKAKAQ